jgi:cytoskeleton protein RodZ
MGRKEDRQPDSSGPRGTGATVDAHADGVAAVDESNAESGSQMTLPLSKGIHAMRAVEATEVNEPNQGSAAPEDEAIREAEAMNDIAEERLGQRLRAAREQHGWSAADVSARLKLPVRLISRLESDDYAGLTEGVFLQGYLASYSRLVGVPVEEATRIAAQHTHDAPLVATGTISRSRYLFDRYSVSATYLILTAIIVVPAVWLATHGGLEQNLARTTPLDPPANIAAAPAHDAAPAGTAETSADAVAAATPSESQQSTQSLPLPQVEQSPVIASMTPFPASPAAPTPAPAESAQAAVGSGAHTLQLKLSEQSWVEITAADGRKLEYGMLAGGSERSYRSDGPVSVRLGNAQGAQVRSDGSLIDLAPFQRGNVAHVKLFGETGASRPEQQ